MSDAWADARLGDVATFASGKNAPASIRSESGSYRMLGANGPIGHTTESLHHGPLITVGRVGAYGEVHFIPDLDCWVSDNALIATPQPGAVTLAFLHLLLQTVDYRSIKSGTTQPLITQSALANVPVKVPPLDAQRRIVDFVTHLDALIECLGLEITAADRALDAARRTLLPMASLLPLESKLLVAKAGGTPDRSRVDFYGGDIKWLKSGEVDNGHIRDTEETITAAGLAGSSAWLVPANTPVIAMYGATAAVSGFVEVPMATNQAVLALVPNPESADARFLFHWLRLNGPRLKAAATGAAQPNLSKQVVLRETGFPDVPLSEQRATAVTLDVLSDLSAQLKRERAAQVKMRTATVAALLSGVVAIPETYDNLIDRVA